jgi:hypothetical protein
VARRASEAAGMAQAERWAAGGGCTGASGSATSHVKDEVLAWVLAVAARGVTGAAVALAVALAMLVRGSVPLGGCMMGLFC